MIDTENYKAAIAGGKPPPEGWIPSNFAPADSFGVNFLLTSKLI
jgi:hypothetical protein